MSPSPVSTTEDCHVLTPAQEAVLCQISAGSTVVAAAEAAGVHRNTVLNWRRNSAHFRAALCCAREEKVLFWRDQHEQLAAVAVEALRSILTDPKASRQRPPEGRAPRPRPKLRGPHIHRGG